MSKLIENLTELRQEYIRLKSSNPSLEILSEEGQRLGQLLEVYETEWNELKARRGQMVVGCPQVVPWSVELDLKLQKLWLEVKQLVSYTLSQIIVRISYIMTFSLIQCFRHQFSCQCQQFDII